MPHALDIARNWRFVVRVLLFLVSAAWVFGGLAVIGTSHHVDGTVETFVGLVCFVVAMVLIQRGWGRWVWPDEVD
jgi:hypothetical protein